MTKKDFTLQMRKSRQSKKHQGLGTWQNWDPISRITELIWEVPSKSIQSPGALVPAAERRYTVDIGSRREGRFHQLKTNGYTHKIIGTLWPCPRKNKTVLRCFTIRHWSCFVSSPGRWLRETDWLCLTHSVQDRTSLYAQLAKQRFAIKFTVKKFHQSNVYGRRFTLITDHKPLLGLLGPSNLRVYHDGTSSDTALRGYYFWLCVEEPARYG